MPREPYPLLLNLAAALTTSLGLIAAAVGIKWGSPPPPGDALPNAWLYVHVLWILTTLILWPAAALRPRASGAVVPLPWQAASLLAGVVPAVAISAYLSSIHLTQIAPLLALQFSATLLALSVLHLRSRCPSAAEMLFVLLAAVTLLGPVAAFLWTQFFPLAPRGWFAALPLVAVVDIATAAKTAGAAPALWLTPALQAGLAGVLFLLTQLPSAQKKAPGTEVPRA
jgi:hypothetical protein